MSIGVGSSDDVETVSETKTLDKFDGPAATSLKGWVCGSTKSELLDFL